MKTHPRWILALTTTITCACSPLTSKTQNNESASSTSDAPASFETSRSGIRFENVDADGLFISHQVIDDPMRAHYPRGTWAPLLKSDVTLLNTDSHATSPNATDNRVNIVFVGDGYTASELSSYAGDVAQVTQQLRTQEPFKTYANYFNYHRVDVVSAESGVSQDPQGETRNTALDMTYYCSGIDRLLCGNLSKIMSAAQNAGAVDTVFAMANSATYGGAGYESPPVATFGARNPGSLELALHEFGHSFGLLSDEYDYAGTLADCASFANISTMPAAQLKPGQAKWFRWLDAPGVGAFEGACYQTKGMYRPTENSKMRTLNQPYGQVNLEQFILKIYRKVRPIDNATAAGTYRAPQIFKITPMVPTDHRLNVRWTSDGAHVTAFDQKTSLDSKQLKLTKGTHAITVTVSDPTTNVRDEQARAQWMTETLTWTLQVD